MRRPDIVRVAQVAELAGLSVRQLQRLFGDYVGASPKWVIDRRRLQSAAARGAQDGPDPDWSAVATELGFADQAHLTRAFAATVGRPPGAFAREGARLIERGTDRRVDWLVRTHVRLSYPLTAVEAIAPLSTATASRPTIVSARP